MMVEELGQVLNLVVYDYDDVPRQDEFLGRFIKTIQFFCCIYLRKAKVNYANKISVIA